MSVPYMLWIVGLFLLLSESSSTSSIISVPLWISSGMTAKSMRWLVFLPSDSVISMKKQGRHLLPPRSRRFQAGSMMHFWIESMSYLYAAGPASHLRYAESIFLGMYFSIVLSMSPLFSSRKEMSSVICSPAVDCFGSQLYFLLMR